VNVSASLMYSLSWILLAVAVLMVMLAIATVLGVEGLPTAAVTDVIAAAVCSLLALLYRSVARRFEHAI
jgi:hypothetical protein